MTTIERVNFESGANNALADFITRCLSTDASVRDAAAAYVRASDAYQTDGNHGPGAVHTTERALRRAIERTMPAAMRDEFPDFAECDLSDPSGADFWVDRLTDTGDERK